MVKGVDTVSIHPHVLHGILGANKGVLIDVFNPIQEDLMTMKL